METKMTLTKEREHEIREYLTSPYLGIYSPAERALSELLSEIDRLRVWSSDSHVTDLEKERDALRAQLDDARETRLAIKYERLKAENEKLEKNQDYLRELLANSIKESNQFGLENQTLRTRIASLRKAIEHVHKYADPEFGWGELLMEALTKDDEMEKKND